jgi:2-deoxy-D-gluconate 3-dehydrogenase
VVLTACRSLGGGIQRRTPAENFSDQDWDDVLQVNLKAVWVISRDAGRHMLESRGGVSGGDPVEEGAADKNPRGRGKIINVASLVSFQGESITVRSDLRPLTTS